MKSNRSHNEPAELGIRAEEAVRLLLAHNGFREVTRNYSAYRLGELDLIFVKDETLYFIEVRLRKEGGNFGGPAESVTPMKRKRIHAAASHFISAYRLFTYDVSFWAACVLYFPLNNRFKVNFVPF